MASEDATNALREVLEFDVATMGPMMMPALPPIRNALALLAATLMLQACAFAPSVQATANQPPPANTGTVVAVRKISVDDRNPAVAQILAALGQPAAHPPEAAVEVIVRRPDNTVVSIIQPAQAAQPNFIPGERIAFLNTAATALHPE
ncbi:MAG: hypothetical protein B7X08_02440 [Acidocella sp. 20-63-7]|nr:MAG: hypothetical protein B7X08_02440 [Acidocella sp. 20-63-7]